MKDKIHYRMIILKNIMKRKMHFITFNEESNAINNRCTMYENLLVTTGKMKNIHKCTSSTMNICKMNLENTSLRRYKQRSTTCNWMSVHFFVKYFKHYFLKLFFLITNINFQLFYPIPYCTF